MAKYGRQHRERERREAKEQLAAANESARWRPNPDESVHEESETDYMETGLIAQRTVRYVRTNQLVEFAVVYKRKNHDGEWDEVLCIDTCNHGTVHRHLNGDHEQSQVIAEITDQSVIQNGFWDAVSEVYDHAYGGSGT